ncbi:hypothetical protein LRP88_06335 [Fusarium phalaenopsidis]
MSDAEKLNTMPAIVSNLNEDEYKKVGRRALFKMDIVIMPTLMIMYILNCLDRNNIAAAKLVGIIEDLDLNDTEYQSCVSILFVGYNPSDMMLGRLKLPGVYICLAMVVWGIVSAAQIVISSFAGLAMARFFIGFVEVVFFPGLLFYLSIFCVQFYGMANEKLQKESSRIAFASLQARLLVTHYLLNHSRMHEAWSTFGIVVRQAQVLDIHRRSPRPPSDHRVGEYRKRLFWVIWPSDLAAV